MRKRFLLGSLVCVMALVLAGAAFAVGHENTGHVGHVSDEAFSDMIDELTEEEVAAVSNDSTLPDGASIVSADAYDLDALVAMEDEAGTVEELKEQFIEAIHSGEPGNAKGNITAIHAVIGVSMNHPQGFGDQALVLDFSGCDAVKKANYVWIEQHDVDEYNNPEPVAGNDDYGSKSGDDELHAFPVVNGKVTIPADEAGYYFSTTAIVATTVTPVSAASDDSSGGCNMGIFAPAAVLLLAPLALLLKR